MKTNLASADLMTGLSGALGTSSYVSCIDLLEVLLGNVHNSLGDENAMSPCLERLSEVTFKKPDTAGIEIHLIGGIPVSTDVYMWCRLAAEAAEIAFEIKDESEIEEEVAVPMMEFMSNTEKEVPEPEKKDELPLVDDFNKVNVLSLLKALCWQPHLAWFLTSIKFPYSLVNGVFREECFELARVSGRKFVGYTSLNNADVVYTNNPEFSHLLRYGHFSELLAFCKLRGINWSTLERLRIELEERIPNLLEQIVKNVDSSELLAFCELFGIKYSELQPYFD